MSNGYRLADSGTKDHRNLIHVILSDGRNAGQVLIKEGLAQLWPNKGNCWCNGFQGTGR
jgi:endonuclease YncB( thermonuclease family)